MVDFISALVKPFRISTVLPIIFIGIEYAGLDSADLLSAFDVIAIAAARQIKHDNKYRKVFMVYSL